VFDDSNTPLEIATINNHIPLTDPSISTEFLEALYTHRTIHTTFTAPDLLRNTTTPQNIWGPFPQSKHLIRHLTISTPEARFHSPTLSGLEHECRILHPELRLQWLSLLHFPRLETLTIKLQKSQNRGFTWANFSPILRHLRHTLPRLRIRLLVSFDEMLKAKWDMVSMLDPVNGGWIMQPEPYLPMGFVDVSELMERPSEEDREYVRQHIGEGSMDAGGRDVYRGLLDETPESRRVLAVHYVVKEPALLRCLVEEHYGVYSRGREE
jgi:hypothetical protein